MKMRGGIIVFLLIMALPVVGLAHTPNVIGGYWGTSPPLVSCGVPGAEQETCTSLCDLLHTVQHAIYLALTLLLYVIAPIAIAAGGMIILTASSSTERLATGKKIVTSAVVGTAIGLGAFLIVNTVLWGLGVATSPEGAGGIAWPGIRCGGTGGGGILGELALPAAPSLGAPPGVSGKPPVCANSRELAAEYRTAYPKQTSRELQDLVGCVLSSNVASLIDRAQIYTWERANDLCNYTRGNPLCGNCAHRVNSCHYGGISLADGAHAVDFNAKNPGPARERDLYLELQKIQQTCRFGSIIYEGDHTHVTTQSCGEGGD